MSLLKQFNAMRPFGGFNLIMADPAWHYTMFSEKGEAKAPQAHYDTMSLDDIKAMPVQALAAQDCLLWLWATNPLLPEALGVMDAWGFTFKTAGTWVKRTKHGKDAFGTGYIYRSSNEPILIGTRGAPKTTRGVRSTTASYSDCCPAEVPASSITIEAIAREHSRKPDEAFQAAEKLMPDAKRIELFSRQKRNGWAVWGNEVEKFDAA
ncbi:hypothetical protein TRP8649_01379 [Pelagimonas phthalicica]|uniref:N6-adenosine-specific RNA methylase IME4 n=1 Tax=Pelagimonas phthalicica TaxID=1037362 RepID=A0A238JBP4_9RHOB|nr:MT-A70 family methyltransferase [Pelagimonas phthalicica]TDS94199.1 N6-adenosine-specific RNA methylase IME4 [Pelagimonas phthalicica]SMX27276.1 hypothetical protein TRP8649_01379 [Pelagimonas phthalicica]